MRIDTLCIKNFKGFSEREFIFHPEFNLIVGTNGTGKTAVLDALAIAVGSWFLGVRGADSRHIRSNEVTFKNFQREYVDKAGQRQLYNQWESLFPCEVTAYGTVQGQDIVWKRALNSPKGHTTYGEATEIKQLAVEADAAIRSGQDILLPLISYYGTGRLWQEPREAFQESDPQQFANKEEQSRLAGYWNSVDPRLSVSQLTRWIIRQTWIAYQQQSWDLPIFNTVRQAMIQCVEGARNLYFDPNPGEVIIEFERGTQPFSNLSDGQRYAVVKS